MARVLSQDLYLMGFFVDVSNYTQACNSIKVSHVRKNEFEDGERCQ